MYVKPETQEALQQIAREYRLKLVDAVDVAVEAFRRLSSDQQQALIRDDTDSQTPEAA